MKDLVEAGDHVVLMKSFDSGNMKIFPVIAGTIVHYGKLHFDPSPLIGCNFGSVFEITDTSMVKVDNFELYDQELSSKVTDKLSTFNEKSQFSQEKIIKRKKKQNHSNIVTVIRPSLLLINEMLYARDKLGGLRSDTVAQILTSANIQNGSKTLLFDHNLGPLTSAVMSRILPDGTCIQLVADAEVIYTTRKTLRLLNISEEACKNKLVALTMRDLYKIIQKKESFSYENDIVRAKVLEHQERFSEYLKQSSSRELGTTIEQINETEKSDLGQILLKKDINRESRNEERILAAKYLKQWAFDSIILIAQNDHPLPILKLMYSFLAPSRQFVIYCDTVEPLLECYQYLKANSLAVMLNLSESWLRRYQVLPDRTRPEMNVSGYGGYLLSGTKVMISAESLSGIKLVSDVSTELVDCSIKVEASAMDVQV